MDIIHQYTIHKYMDNQMLLLIFHGLWMISMYIYIWLVVYLPLSSSVGIMTFPTEWKNVPNHQPDYFVILVKS